MTLPQVITIAGLILACTFLAVFVVFFWAASVYLVIERARLSRRGFQDSRHRSGRRCL
jgi:ABC-type arginine/histidine transport system permease subunit